MLKCNFMISEVTNKVPVTYSLEVKGDPSPGTDTVRQNGGLQREKAHFLWGWELFYVAGPFPRTFLGAGYTADISTVFLNKWNLGTLWICLVDIKTVSLYLYRNETTPPKLLLWELCVLYVKITLITANANQQQLPHTKLQLKGTMPGPLRTYFTFLLQDVRKMLELLGKSRGRGGGLISSLKVDWLVMNIPDAEAGWAFIYSPHLRVYLCAHPLMKSRLNSRRPGQFHTRF